MDVAALLAHESWFTEARPAYDWGFALAGPSLLLIVGAVGVALACVFTWLVRRRPRGGA